MDLRLEPSTVVVFDLDDTLYFERDFVRSGFNAIRAVLAETRGMDIGGRLWDSYSSGNKDALGEVCREFGLPDNLKDELLQVYRFHQPDIALREGAQALLDTLAARDVPLALITDGRSLSQRRKLAALGILDRFACVCVSAEIGHEKPHPLAFELVMEQLPAQHYVYIGDNSRKDFVVPRRLGWRTIGVRTGGLGIHGSTDVAADHQPDVWVDALTAIRFV